MKSKIPEPIQNTRNSMRKNHILIIALTLISALGFSQTDKRLKGIEKQFNSVLESTNTAGFAVAIVEGDKIIYA